MKLVLTLVTILCLGLSAFAQEVTKEAKLPRAVVKLSAHQFIWRTMEIGMESLSSDYSRSIQVSVGFRSGSNDYPLGKGASLEIAYRRYFHTLGSQPSYGFYYSPCLNASHFQGTSESLVMLDYEDGTTGPSELTLNHTEKIAAINPGISIGLQRIFWNALCLDVAVGGGYRFTNHRYINVIEEPGHSDLEDALNRIHKEHGRPGDKTMTEPGYKGFFPKIEVKIGLAL